MRRKTALLAALLAALLLPAPALAQTVSEGLIEVVGTLDLDALAAAAEDAPWLEGGVEQVITRLASGQAALTADEALRWLMDEAAGVRAERVAHHAPAGSCAAGGGGGADRRAGQGGRKSRALRGTDHDDGVSRCGPARARGPGGGERRPHVRDDAGHLPADGYAAGGGGRHGQLGFLSAGGDGCGRFHDHADQPCHAALCGQRGGAHHGGESQRRASHIAGSGAFCARWRSGRWALDSRCSSG